MKFHSAAAARACGCATHRLDAQLLASDFTFAPSGSGGNGGSSAPAAAPSALYPVPGFAESTARPSYAPNLVLEPFHMAIRLAFDLRAKRVRGTVTHSVRHNGPAAPSPATASLSRTLVLNAVSLDIAAVTSAGHAVSHTYDGKLLTATWETPFAPDEVRDLTVEYTAEDPIAGLYFCAPLPHEAAERVLHCATDHETERARYWLPCVDFPTVRTSLEFHLTHDAGLVAVANGAEVGVVENADGTKTTSYKLDHRCPSYLLCLAVGEFVTAEDETVDGMPIRYLATKNYTKEQLMLSFGKTPSMVRWLQKKVGHKFPWPKYYQIFTPFGGAMENISLVTYNDMFLIADEIRTREMGYFTDLVNLHEMAHTYFGDLLVVRHFEHAWLKESWATYMESCWLEDHKPKEEFEFDLFGNSEAYFEECNDYVRPIVCRTFNSSWNLFDRHLYPGGAMRIHMLRQILGDEAFWAGVRTYVSRFSGKIVETEDFKRCLEEASGLNLTRFFDQWLYSPGYPKLKATYKYHNDTGLAEVVLSQTQAPDDGSGVPAVFDITVEVDIVGEDGAVHSGAASFDSVIGLRTATVFIPIGKGAKKPLVVEIDPRNKVLHSLEFSPGEDVLGATAKRGRDIRSRIRSYRELIKDGSYTAMKKVKELLPEEPFFGVRNFVYSALSKSKSHASVSILASALHTERNTRALLRLLSNVSFRHPALRDGLLALSALPASETSYLARARVFEALGRQRHPDDVALLLARLADPTELGFQGSIRAGVLRGLGHTQSGRSTRGSARSGDKPASLVAAANRCDTRFCQWPSAHSRRLQATGFAGRRRARRSGAGARRRRRRSPK
ncbi:hypothetical protein DFJ73DRAFT_132331 [Zopfochytrium polystomum]|nr:hypothetical protein DFJ73DRAFT_132331 [Zopfochytrium polystomum]